MSVLLELVIVFAAIMIGVRFGGIALGFWGGMGLFILSVVFGIMPTSPPVDVLLIILAVCMCASCMEAVGGLDILIRIAAKIIRKNPRYVAVIAPLVAFFLTFLAGTGNAVYAILPVVYEVSYNAGIRPERAMAGATVAGQVGITACPISAATAAMLGLLAQNQFDSIGLGSILMITFPSCLIGVLAASFICMFWGRELKDDPVYQARLAAGQIQPPKQINETAPISKEAKWSVLIFFGAIVLIVLAGFFPELRLLHGQSGEVSMSLVIECVMLAAAALICLLGKPNIDQITRSSILHAGVVSIGCVFGIAWMSDSFISANSKIFLDVAGSVAQSAPYLFTLILAGMAALMTSQGATTRAIMPLGFALGINPYFLVAMFPAVNCIFFLPITGTALATIGMDLSGTTRIGKYVLNHSFQLPCLVSIFVAVAVGYAMANLLFL